MSTVGLLAVYMILMLGMVMGASQGYAAQNVTAAQVDYNGTHMQVGTQPPENTTIAFNESETTPTERVLNRTVGVNQSALPQHERVQGAVHGHTRGTARTMFRMAFTAADYTATFIYYNQWLPKPLVTGVLRVGAYVPILGIFYFGYRKVEQYT